MRPAQSAAAILLGSLSLVAGSGYGSGAEHEGAPMALSRSEKIEPDATVGLAADRPWFAVPIELKLRKAPPRRLELALTRVDNPALISFSICAHLGWGHAPSDSVLVPKIEIGCIGVFPADRTGVYQIGADAAMRRLKAETTGVSLIDLRLLLELRPFQAVPKERPLRVEISNLAWSFD